MTIEHTVYVFFEVAWLASTSIAAWSIFTDGNIITFVFRAFIYVVAVLSLVAFKTLALIATFKVLTDRFLGAGKHAG